MANNRTNRDQETRAQETRYEYVPASTLPDPTPEPGYTYRSEEHTSELQSHVRSRMPSSA